MKIDLADEQWTAVGEGHLTGPDGRRFVRRSTKAKRRRCDALVAEGVPVVLYYWAGGQLDWHGGADAVGVWQTVRKAVISREPNPKGDTEWTAGVWETDDGDSLLVLTGHC